MKPAALASRSGTDSRWDRFVKPGQTGLPNWRVVTAFPLMLALGAGLLIILRISGSSSGAHWAYFGSGEDPNLLLGRPLGIRSDEWFVHQAWVISQIQQGFPLINQTLPGGMDMSVALETPVWEWSAIFRPHIWGYFMFGADAGLAWEWWIPALALVSGAYLLVVTYLPRRPITAALLACSAFFTPIFQWWYGTSSLYPAAWSFLALAATVWLLRDGRLWVRIAWAAVVGWLAVTMALGLYAPFIIPGALVFLFCFIGSVLNERPFTKLRLKRVFVRVLPLIVAGIAALGIFAVWALTRLDTISAISSTVYPGQRLKLAGQMIERDPFMTWFGGAAWGQSLQYNHGETALGPNASEASTVILLALFLIPGVVYLLVTKWRRDRRWDWLATAVLVADVVFMGYLFVPGWDALAHLLFLDRVPMQRIWIGFAVLLPLTVALLVRHLDQGTIKFPRWLPVVTGTGVLAIHGLLLWRIASVEPELLMSATLWPFAVSGIVAASVLVYYPRTVTVAAVCLLAVSLMIAGRVNPLYVGAFDLRETKTGQAIAELDRSNEGTWLGVGSQEVMALLMQSGVEAYNGVQIYPPKELWEEVDPDGDQEDVWNRLGHIQWQFGGGEPDLVSPQVDVVRGTFDACSDFAQENVDYVITDQVVDSLACMTDLITVKEANISFKIFRVVEPEVTK